MSDDKLVITVTIPAHNRASRLDLCLDSLRRCQLREDWRMDIVVCDDGSTEDLWSICQKYNAYCVRHMKNMGTAQARRTLISHSWGTYVWLLDADMYVAPLAVHSYLSVVHSEVACVGRMNKMEDVEAEHVLSLPPDERFTYLSSRKYLEHRHDWPSDKTRKNTPHHWAFTGNIMFWGSDFRAFAKISHDIQGWGHDDTVLVYNIHKGNVDFVTSDSAQVWHIQRDIIREGNLGRGYTSTAIANRDVISKYKLLE